MTSKGHQTLRIKMKRESRCLANEILLYLEQFYQFSYIDFGFVIFKNETSLRCNLLFGLIGHFALSLVMKYEEQ